MSRYICVSLPKQLIKKVDVRKKEASYSSRAEFVKESIRRELERLDKCKGEA